MEVVKRAAQPKSGGFSFDPRGALLCTCTLCFCLFVCLDISPGVGLLDHQFSSVAQSCLTLLRSRGLYLPGSSVRGISQARILEWAAISRLRDQTRSSCIVGRFFLLRSSKMSSSENMAVSVTSGWVSSQDHLD